VSAALPQNLDAEEYVLGALMLAGADGPEASAKTVAAVLATGLRAGDFFRLSHGVIFSATLAVAERGEPTEVLLVEHELEARGQLADVDGRSRVRELAKLVPAIGNAPHHAGLVIDAADQREQLGIAVELGKAACNGGLASADPELRERVARLLGPSRSAESRLTGLSNADVRGLDPPPTVLLVENLIEAGTLGQIAALPESNKSWLAQEVTHKVAAGGKVLGRFEVLKTGPVGYWWEDDSTANEARRIQAYAARHGYDIDLPIRWHLNDGLRLPDDLPLLRMEVEREGQVLVVIDSVYNVLPGFALKEEDVAAVYTAIKREVCDPTGATVLAIDHAPWPTEGNKGQRRAYGSVFKAAAIRWGIYLERQGETFFVEARGNNLVGLPRTAALWDADRFELRLTDPRKQDVELADRIDEFLARNVGAATSVVQGGVQGGDREIRRELEHNDRFVTVPPAMFGRPRNAVCWARAVDAPARLKNGGER
jgi:AAA domain/DnaB-like helicase N terminal domain